MEGEMLPIIQKMADVLSTDELTQVIEWLDSDPDAASGMIAALSDMESRRKGPIPMMQLRLF